MFVLHLSLAILSFSVKLNSFALASKAKIILHLSGCVLIFQENANLIEMIVKKATAGTDQGFTSV